MEWIARNGKPDYVFLALTIAQRFEVARVCDQNLPIEGPYIVEKDIQHYDIMARLSDSCYMPYDYAFMNTIFFSSWLEQQGIKHIIWDHSNKFDKKDIRGFNGLEKLKFIDANPRIVPLFEFCGAQYMFDNGGDWAENEAHLLPHIRHFTDESYNILKDYLDDYIQNTLNEKVEW